MPTAMPPTAPAPPPSPSHPALDAALGRMLDGLERALRPLQCQRVILALHVLCLCVTIGVFWSVEVPALADGPNHMARVYIANHVATDPDFARMYTVQWRVVPYMAYELIAGSLEPLIGIYNATKVFLTLCFLTIIGGVLLLNHTIHGRLTPWSLLAQAFLYTNVLAFGFFNFYLSLGVALIGLAMWLRTPHKTPRFYALYAMFGVLLYFTHVFGLAILGLTIGLVEWFQAGPFAPRRLSQDWFRNAFRRGMDGAWKVLTFTAVPMVITGMLETYGNEFGYKTEYFIFSKWYSFVSPIYFADSVWPLAAMIFLFLCLFFRILEGGYIKNIFLTLFATTLLMPSTVHGIHGADLRIPIFISLVLICALQYNRKTQSNGAKVYDVVVVGIFLVSTGASAVSAMQSHRVCSGMAQEIVASKALEKLRGKSLLTIYGDAPLACGFDMYGWNALYNISSIFAIEYSAFVPEIYNGLPPLVATELYKDFDGAMQIGPSLKIFKLYNENRYEYLKLLEKHSYHEIPMFWHHWEKGFDYIVLHHFGTSTSSPHTKLEKYYTGTFFDIYKVIKPAHISERVPPRSLQQ